MYQNVISGCKSFDDLAKHDCITTGNVYGNAQLSGFVRGKQQTECNGYNHFSEGELQKHDLSLFDCVPSRVMSEVKEAASTKDSVIFYEFRTFKPGKSSKKEKFVHAYVICNSKNELQRVFVNRKGRKSIDVANAVIPRIAMDSNGKFTVDFF